jgi:hypothetical protein
MELMEDDSSQKVVNCSRGSLPLFGCIDQLCFAMARVQGGPSRRLRKAGGRESILFFGEDQDIAGGMRQSKGIFIPPASVIKRSSASMFEVRSGPSCRSALAPPSLATCSCSPPGGAMAQERSRKNEMKLDLPAPLGPINTVSGPGAKSFSSRIVLKPRRVTLSDMAS